jgi:hypothetical protein
MILQNFALDGVSTIEADGCIRLFWLSKPFKESLGEHGNTI